MTHHWNFNKSNKTGVHSEARKNKNTSEATNITPFLSVVSLIIFLLYITNIIGQQAIGRVHLVMNGIQTHVSCDMH